MNFSLDGVIASNEDAEIYRYFDMRAVCPADLKQALKDNPPHEEFTLEVNSNGGDVYAGFEMYSLLRSAAVPIRAEVQSLAASAASVVLMGADIAAASPVGQIMIHLPSTVTYGNQTIHRQRTQMLESVTDSIITAYEKKCRGKTTREELRQMMDKETFLTAQQAFDMGLLDEITDRCPTTILNAAGGLPDIVQMRRLYREYTAGQTNENRRRKIEMEKSSFDYIKDFMEGLS